MSDNDAQRPQRPISGKLHAHGDARAMLCNASSANSSTEAGLCLRSPALVTAVCTYAKSQLPAQLPACY